MSFLKDLFELSLAEDSRTAAYWRLFIALLLTTHIAWACGWLPGVSGFAFAGEVHKLTTEFREHLVTDLEEKLFNMQERLCELRFDPDKYSVDKEARYKERIRNLMRAYRDLADHNYVLDQCALL